MPNIHKNKIMLFLLAVPALFYILIIYSHAQMPDWTLIIDKDNNRFYLDGNGKIWTSGIPEFDYKPVSVEGLDYYLNQGIELIKSHKKSEGLTLLKSIIALPVKNDVTYKAQIAASKEINHLIKIEGRRYKYINENASLLLFKVDNSVILKNDDMLYSIRTPEFIKIISTRTRQKLTYKYHGMLLGLKFREEAGSTKKEYSAYDLLIAIDSEKFPTGISDVKHYANEWRKKLGSDTLNRELVIQDKSRIVNTYKYSHAPNYSGFECFYTNNNYGYYLKAITSAELFTKYKLNITEIINSFKI